MELGERDRAAAPPPTPLNSATICGIAVIFTLRAADRSERCADRGADDDLPVRCARRVAQRDADRDAIPNAPTQFPRRAVVGDERNRSASMKQMIVTR